MSKRKLVFTDSERKRLFFNKGCSGCLAYAFVFPFEVLGSLFIGIIESLGRMGKRPFGRRRR